MPCGNRMGSGSVARSRVAVHERRSSAGLASLARHRAVPSTSSSWCSTICRRCSRREAFRRRKTVTCMASRPPSGTRGAGTLTPQHTSALAGAGEVHAGGCHRHGRGWAETRRRCAPYDAPAERETECCLRNPPSAGPIKSARHSSSGCVGVPTSATTPS